MSRFDLNIPDVLIAQAHTYLSHEHVAVIRGLSRAQSDTGHRFSPAAICTFCAEHRIPSGPVLRALGWGPKDRCMITGRVTHVLEDMPHTSGAALCALAKRH